MIRSPLPGYMIRRIYVVICNNGCNEEISRTLGGDEPETVSEAQQSVRDHDRVFHSGAG